MWVCSSSIVRMRVPVYGSIFYTLVIFFDHQSHGSFCSSLKAWGLIQRSSETCKLSISHCKVCKPPSALPLVHYSCTHPSEWMTPPLFSGGSYSRLGERRPHNYTSALCFSVLAWTSQTGLWALIWTALFSPREVECSFKVPLFISCNCFVGEPWMLLVCWSRCTQLWKSLLGLDLSIDHSPYIALLVYM